MQTSAMKTCNNGNYFNSSEFGDSGVQATVDHFERTLTRSGVVCEDVVKEWQVMKKLLYKRYHNVHKLLYKPHYKKVQMHEYQ